MSSGPPQPYFVEILRRGSNPAVGDEYFNRRVSLSFNIHLRYLLCVGKTTSAYCSTNSTIVAVFFVYGKSSRNAIRFPVTKVPVSTIVALHSKVLCSLHGRMSSDPP